MLKRAGGVGFDIMNQICNKIWTTGKWPKDWTDSVDITLHKKGKTATTIEPYPSLATLAK